MRTSRLELRGKNRRSAIQKIRRFAIPLSCFVIIFIFPGVILFPASAAWGAVTGSISGTVKDPQGKVVPDAEVTVRELGTGIKHGTRSNGSGYYTLPVLPVGRYELVGRARGSRATGGRTLCWMRMRR